jgi:LCP family protein required for cell wall assembly
VTEPEHKHWLPEELTPRTGRRAWRRRRGPKGCWPIVRNVALALAAVVAVGAGGTYALYRHFNGQITRVNIRLPSAAPPPDLSSSAQPSATEAGRTSKLHPASSEQAENVLMMGSDSRSFAGGQAYNVAPGSAAYVTGQRSDVVMLLHIPATGAAATVVSFPRDSWVQLPEFTDSAGVRHAAVMAKLNAAFDLGGAPLLVSTLEDVTGIHIDHFASINFPGFQGMVNAIGGINVCIGTTRHDTNSGDFLTAGDHHLNGVQALALVRDRESFANQDLGRIKDQEYFLSVMLHQVLSAGTLTNPLKLTEFLNVATKSLTVDTGLTVGDMRKLAGRFAHLSSGNVTFQTVPVANPNYRVTSSVYGSQPQSAVELDTARSAALFADLAEVPSPASPVPSVPADQVQLTVENGTATAGLAHQVASELRSDGFIVTGTGNAPAIDDGGPVISYGPAGLPDARALRSRIPEATLQLDPAAASNAVVLTLGINSTIISPNTSLAAVPSSSPMVASALSCAP